MEEAARVGGRDRERFLCPHCGAVSIHVCLYRGGYAEPIQVKDRRGAVHQTSVRRNHWVYKCINCDRDTYFLYQLSATQPTLTGLMLVEDIDLSQTEGMIHQFPINVVSSVHPAIPTDVADGMVEAEKCLAVGAFHACGTMARRAVDAICVASQAEGENTFARLQELRDKHVITPDLWKWAEEMRVGGRSEAEADWDALTKDEAAYVVQFLREIVQYVYINPYDREQRMLKETKRKPAEAEP